MKKLIAPAVAAATAFTLTVPATATAATLTPFTENDNHLCRVSLNDAERGPAWQAERAAKTLTIGVYATSAVEAFEATFPELKQLGDAYGAHPAVQQHLRAVRDGKDSPDVGARNAARAAAKPKLAAVGLKNEDADEYLDLKETALVPLSPSAQRLVVNADWYIGIDGNAPKVAKLGRDHEVGKTGRNVARGLYFVQDWQRDAFATNLDKTYFGKVFGTLESTFYYPLLEARQCNAGKTHVIFPMGNLGLPDAPVLKNADLGDAASAPAPSTPTPSPAPEAPEAPQTMDAKLAQIIGIIAAVLTALGALFALLQNAGFNVPQLPAIPGLTK